MREVDMICVQCPLGCRIKVTLDDDEKVTDINGFTCKNGKEYAMQEVTDPQRVIPTNVKVTGGDEELVSVKTTRPVPKRLIWSIMDEIRKTSIPAPVKIGQVIIGNILGTGADVVATREVNAR